MRCKLIFIFAINLLILSSCFDGKKESNLKEHKTYYKSGKIKEKFYTDELNNKQGAAYVYYENGKIKEQQHFLNGKANGIAQYYYSNGKIEVRGKFKNNIQIDTTINYHENGFKDAIAIYDKKGQVLKEIAYYPNGKINLIRTFYVGSGQINSYKAYFDDGKLNEEESRFVEIKTLGNNQNLLVKLHNNEYLDSIKVNIIKDFLDTENGPEILRTIKFSNTNNLKFEIKDSDFVNDKISVEIIAEKWIVGKKTNIYQNLYSVQFDKNKPIPKDNLEGIYRKY